MNLCEVIITSESIDIWKLFKTMRILEKKYPSNFDGLGGKLVI